MKKIISFLFFISLFSSNICFSQSGWFWQNPLPQGNSLNSVFFVSNQIGYSAGESGTVIKTINSGANWIVLETGSIESFRSLYFTNELTGFVAGGRYNTSVLYKTTNGGVNWNVLSVGIDRQLWDIHFTNSYTGLVVGAHGTIVKTTNSGNNWLILSSGVTNSLYSINLIGPNTGYCCGTGGVILKTTNAGDNWASYNVEMNTELSCIYFNNEITGYTCGIGGRIFKTTNSGVNWTIMNTGTTVWLRSIKFVNSNLGFAVGGINDNFVILKTTNSGSNWQIINVAAKYAFNSLFAIDTSTILIAGSGGTVFKTTTSGLSWNLLTGNESELRDVYFRSVNEGIAIGYEGDYLRTSNGGINWNSYNIGVTEDLNSFYFINNSNGFIVGNNGLLLKTTNSGSNWTTLNININYTLNKIRFVNQNFGIIVGNFGTLKKSTDSGNTWNTCTLPTAIVNIFDCFFFNENTGYVVGDNRPDPNGQGRVHKTTNSCTSWTSTWVSPYYIKSIFFLNNNFGFAGCENGYIYRTTDNGINWQQVSSTSSFAEINCFYFLDNLTGYIAFGHDYGYGGILKTTNGGAEWNELYLNTNNGLYALAFINSLTGFVIGQYGTIFKTTNGGGNFVGINTSGSETLQSFSLSQNYPNPFNPVTKIIYQIPAVGQRHAFDVRLIIYDILGREIETLVNDTQKPGSYEVNWDGSRFASGVYFYWLITDEYVETKKMVLIK